jgi:AcrR family transcriptional regulator
VNLQQAGLRERKKLKTRAAIQREALRLFRERGFHATTIERIAEAADIAPATFFNYFQTKEDVIFQDDLDPLVLTALNSQPLDLSPIRALRNALHDVYRGLSIEQAGLARGRLRLIYAEPELRAAMLNQFTELVQDVAATLAIRVGRDAGDFAVRNLAGALIGVITASTLAATDDPEADYLELIDTAMAHLEAGLPL